ncbi:class I SAM-dependent methyltransferase [Planococcus koreensis]|uniref:class I SAM-dependent methyltransferase n=1 Tax=Planococcus koreensis TaxID=112331 RepID=UPI0039FCE0A1
MKLYKELADWWPLMSPHTEYEEEASLYLDIIRRHHPEVKKAVEFGSGGGSNAFYLKQHFAMTLSDLSEDMLAVSRKLNSELPHLQGDMRTIDAGTGFDLVFIHDAIMYFTETADLLAVMENAKKHLHEDGILFIMADQFTETFQPTTNHGGTDSGDRGMRYLEWTFDSNPHDHATETEYLYILKDSGGITREHDSTRSGLFSMPEWRTLLKQAGFQAEFERVAYSSEPGTYFAIVAKQAE